MFLEESTYFFKIKAFAKNFPKERATGKYARVDFAYLRELAVLDAHLRKLIVSIALDVEHFLKVGLIKDVSENSKEDGYEVVSGPRTRGDGYYESCVVALEGNQIEITV